MNPARRPAADPARRWPVRARSHGLAAPWLAVVCGVLSSLSVAHEARADSLRPPDAPRSGPKIAEPPPLPSEYREIDLDGIRFSYHPSAREHIRALFDRAGGIRAELAEATGAPVLRRVEIRVAAVPAEMVQLAPAAVPASASIVTFFDQRLVVMSVLSPAGGPPLDVEAALTHALAHLALDEATGGAPVPAWFHEGLATHAQGLDLARSRAMTKNALLGRPPLLDDLARSSPDDDLVRAEAADFVRFVAASKNKAGQPALAGILRRVKAGEPFDEALLAELGVPSRPALDTRWREDRARRHAFAPLLVAALVIAALIAAAVRWIQTARRARKASIGAPPRRERSPSTSTKRPARAPTSPRLRAPAKVVAAARAAAGPGTDTAVHVHRDPDVPKVEHDGKWHTLH